MAARVALSSTFGDFPIDHSGLKSEKVLFVIACGCKGCFTSPVFRIPFAGLFLLPPEIPTDGAGGR